MPNEINKIELKTLDRHLSGVRVYERPPEGWIYAIRTALGMSGRQLATRLGFAKQSQWRLEANEVDDSITLRSLRRAAAAMDCELVYALVPRGGSLRRLVQKQARKKAGEIVHAVDHSMKLEAQGVGGAQEKIRQTADKLAQNPNPDLWD